MWIDIIRYADFAMFGVGSAFMFITNVLSFKVLKPPKRFGFLWWHVAAITVAFLCLGTIVIWLVFSRLDKQATWQTPTASIGFLTFMIAQILIFTVERQRYVDQIVLEKMSEGES